MANGIEVTADEKTLDGLFELWGDQISGKEGAHSENIVALDALLDAMSDEEEKGEAEQVKKAS